VQPLDVALTETLRRLGLERGIAGWRAVEEWPAVVGPRIARRTRAVEFRDGTLVVEVEGSAWLHELGFLKRELLEQLARRLGPRHVVDLRFVMPRGRSQR
jgi:predicted nucleic acid-binding Zn ribbon protein